METFNSNYKSFVLGSVRSINNCLDIVLYNKLKIDRKISLYNLEEFYRDYLSGSDTDIHKRLSRSSYTEDFLYRSGLLEDGFNVVVYISPSSNTPLGYTEFINTQGLGRNLRLSINIKRTLNTVLIPDYPKNAENFSLELTIRNNISDNNPSKNYTGDKLYNYVKASEVLSGKYENLYTNDTGRILSDPRSIIYSPSSGVMCRDNFWKFRINKDINIDPYSDDYDSFKVCYYNNDLVIAGWSSNGSTSYSMYSLINRNSLGLPLVRHENTRYNISEIFGKYYEDENGNLRYLDNSRLIESTEGETLVYDHQDSRGILYSLRGYFSKSEVIKYIPEINNIYLDLDNYLRSNQLVVYKKIGSWFILTQKYGGNTIYLAVSPVAALYMSQEDLEQRAFFVNDQTIILREQEYYVIYNSSNKKLYTERARTIIMNGIFELYGDTGIYMCVIGDKTDEDHYLEYYDSELVHIVFKYEDLHSTVLNKYRRNYYPSEVNGIPEIIDTFKGLIFYKQDNIITYL